MLRDFNFCVIDEVDSILVDEARTPLIISGNAERPSARYYQVLLGFIRPKLPVSCRHALLPLQKSAVMLYYPCRGLLQALVVLSRV